MPRFQLNPFRISVVLVLAAGLRAIAQEAQEQDPDWPQQLPSVGAVRQKVGSELVWQDASFAVLMDYIEASVGQLHGSWSAGVNPLAAQRWEEYHSAVSDRQIGGLLLEHTLSREAGEYYGDSTFRIGSVALLVSPQAAASYLASPMFQENLKYRRAMGYPSGPNPTMTARMDRQNSQQSITSAVIESLRRDRSDAVAHHVDMTVLGIALGKPLTLAPCPAAVAPTTSCVAKEGSSDNLVEGLTGLLEPFVKPNKLANGDVEITSVPVSTFPVYIEQSARPDWLPSRFVKVSTIGGHVVKVVIGPLGKMFDDKMESVLTAKYNNRNPFRKDRYSCVRDGVNYGNFSTRIWSMYGLQATHAPLTNPLSDCGGFEVRFETVTYQRLKEAASRSHESAQPKL